MTHNFTPGLAPSLGTSFAEPLARFAARAGLASEERQALLSAVSEIRHLRADDCLREQGSLDARLYVLCEGLAQSTRILADGRQQILALFVPGDVMDCAPIAGPARSRLCALTAARVACITRPALEALLQRHPALMRGLWSESARHGAIQQEWMVALGRQSSYARLAHFICEVTLRFRDGGLAQGEECPFPLTQADIADALGISVVHVNRVLQQLRKDGLVALTRGVIAIKDQKALYQIAEFDPDYLRTNATIS